MPTDTSALLPPLGPPAPERLAPRQPAPGEPAASAPPARGPSTGAAIADGKSVEELVAEGNKLARMFNVSLSFEIDEDIDRVVISVVDESTHQVIRKIPPEEILRALRRLQAVRGFMLDAVG